MSTTDMDKVKRYLVPVLYLERKFQRVQVHLLTQLIVYAKKTRAAQKVCEDWLKSEDGKKRGYPEKAYIGKPERAGHVRDDGTVYLPEGQWAVLMMDERRAPGS